jgi:hypothetical protein
MKWISSRLMSCCAAILVIAGSNVAMAETDTSPTQFLPVLDQSSGDSGSFCLDSMETVPFSDDLEPTPISVDGGCSTSEGTIAT